MTILALEYRPQRFADIVGQAHIKPVLLSMVLQQNPPPSMLFTGSRGTGKTTTARILAAALNCENTQKGDACGECSSCKAVQAGNSLAVIEIDAASNGTVGDIRKIREAVSYSHSGQWRVVLLDEAHSMSKEAFNALLKTLEEPPPNTIFVLLTTEANKILDTVVSRSMVFDFRRMSVENITGRLAHIAAEQQIEAQPDLLVEIATRAQGGMRDAVMLLDHVSRVGVTDAASFREHYGIQDIAIPLLTAAVKGDLSAGLALVEDYFYRVGDAAGMVNDLSALVRDILVLKGGGKLVGLSTEAEQARQPLVARLDVPVLVDVIKVLWELKARVRAVDNDQRASMDMALVLIMDVVGPKRGLQASTPISTKEAPRLSLAEMARAVS